MSHIPGGPEQLSAHEMKSASNSSPAHINRLQARNLYGEECQIQCDGNYVGNVEISSYHSVITLINSSQLKAAKSLLISYSCNDGTGYSH
jgi:hypothetical protein